MKWIAVVAITAAGLLSHDAAAQTDEVNVMRAVADYLRPQFKGQRIGLDPRYSDHGPRRDLRAGEMEAVLLRQLSAALPARAIARENVIRCGSTRGSCHLVEVDIMMVFSRPIVEGSRAVIYWSTDARSNSASMPLEGMMREIILARIRGTWVVRSVRDVAWS